MNDHPHSHDELPKPALPPETPMDAGSQALAEALKNRVIAGAGIDVYDVEPPRADYPLFGLPNAILTPHLAWYSENAGRHIRELIVLEIDRFLAGQPPRYIAKPAV